MEALGALLGLARQGATMADLISAALRAQGLRESLRNAGLEPRLEDSSSPACPLCGSPKGPRAKLCPACHSARKSLQLCACGCGRVLDERSSWLYHRECAYRLLGAGARFATKSAAEP